MSFWKSIAKVCGSKSRGSNSRRHSPVGGAFAKYQRVFQSLETRLMLSGNPVANSDSYYGSSGTGAVTAIPAAQGVLANDTDPNNLHLTAVLITAPHYGGVTLNSDGSFTYTCSSSYAPGDSFQYEAYNGTSYSTPATVTLRLSSGGALPHAANDSFSAVHDRTTTLNAPGVLSNDSDPNNLPLTAVLETNPSHGTVSLNANGGLSYTPATHFVGSDSFTYEASNGGESSSPATVNITVTDQAPQATNDGYSLANGQTFTTTAASGVLANDNDADGDTLTASVATQPSHGSLTLNSDGSFSYTPNAGWVGSDSFSYTASDGVESSSPATVTLHTEYSVLSATDETKVPLDTVHLSQQILSDPFDQGVASPLPGGGLGPVTVSAIPADGAPATAHNLSLVYDSVLGQPDQVIEANVGLSNAQPMSDTLTASLTFNGVVQPAVYFNMNTLNGTDSHIHLAEQVDTSGLASGRYPWSMTVTSPDMAAPATVSGFVNVVNDSASPFGRGWDMPGLFRLFQNTASGVPAGVLLSTGDGGAWYFTQGTGNSYSSPAGPFAFDTLTSVTGGGWQLVDKFGTTFSFNSSGYLTSRLERTGLEYVYNWSGGELTSIVDPFGRAVNLTYASGLLSSISDFAGKLWTMADTSGELTSITEPDPGGGSPVWQFGYTGNYLTSETDPNSNLSSFVLDAYHRLSQTDLPGGGNTADTSEQDFGYGSTSQSNPGSLTLESSVTPSGTDAMGNQQSFQTNSFGETISQTDSYGNTTTTQRDANGLPTVITQPPPAAGDASPVTTVSYDTLGNELSATGAMPSYGTWAYNTLSEPTSFTDLLSHEWLLNYSTSGNLLSEQDPTGDQVSWTFDTYGAPLTMTTPTPGNVGGTVTTQFHYDQYERLVEIVWPDNSTEQFAYDADDRRTTVTDEDNHSTVTGFDALGRVVTVTNAAQGVVSTTYDKNGNVLSTRDEMGNETDNTWNARNELVKQVLPDPDGAGPLTSPVWQWTYDLDGHQLTATDPLNRVTSQTWDKLGRLTLDTLPDPDGPGPLTSPTIATAYDNISRKISQTNALSGTTTLAYGNADERLVTSVTAPDPDGSGPLISPVTQFGYNANGQQVTVLDAMNHTSATTLDADGRATVVTDNLNHATTSVLDALSNVVSTTDALSHTTTNGYDSRSRLISTTAADGGVTQITLDPAGNRTALVDPANNQTTWTFNALNEPLTETNSDGTETWTYDASSAVTSITDKDGRVRDFQHDNLHRLTAEQWMSGSTVVRTIAYSYDAANELLSANDPDSAYAFAHDGDGNVTSVDNAGTPNVPEVVLAAAYDSMGDRTSLSATVGGTSDFLNNYVYDADQRLTSEQQQQQTGGNGVSPKEVDYAYNSLGQFATVARYDFIGIGPRTDVATGTYSYDADNRLTGLAYTADGGANSIDAYAWGYDNANDVTSMSSTVDGSTSYGYDPTNQLTSATYVGANQPPNESYAYDKNGNRTNTGYTTGANNELTSDGTFSYQHDAEGNLTVRTRISGAYATDYRVTYSWDYRDRLTDVNYYDNNSVLTKHVHYVYDVFDHLLATEADTTGSGGYNDIEHYILDVSPEAPVAGQPGTALADPLLIMNGTGVITARMFNGPGADGTDTVIDQEAISTPGQAGTDGWALADNANTGRYIINDNSVVIDHIMATGFGQVTSESNPAIAHWAGFEGGHVDPFTGLVNDYHRWYESTTGNWLSADPGGFAAADANLSRFVRNNAANLGDPTGLAPPEDSAPPDDVLNSSGGAYMPNFFSPYAMSTGQAVYTGGKALYPQPPNVAFTYGKGTYSLASYYGGTWGWGQPSSQCSGNFSQLMGPNSAMTNVTVTGPDVCNTCQAGSNPNVFGGSLTAWVNYPPGLYMVPITYTATLTTSGSGVTGTANITTPGSPAPIAQLATPPQSGVIGVLPSFVTGSVLLPVQLNGGWTQVMTISPSLAGAGTGSASFSGAISIGPVSPYFQYGGQGGGF